jgi:hypothetical protein
MSLVITGTPIESAPFPPFYGSTVEADAYFALRLHEFAWTRASDADKPKALLAATRIIDGLNFKGQKHSVYTLLHNIPSSGEPEVAAAESAQPLEFPRGSDEEVPADIKRACYEIAHSLLDGKDPEAELEALAVASQTYGSVRTSYERGQVPIEHLINMVPNALAWRLIRPYLRDADALTLSRIS